MRTIMAFIGLIFFFVYLPAAFFTPIQTGEIETSTVEIKQINTGKTTIGEISGSFLSVKGHIDGTTKYFFYKKVAENEFRYGDVNAENIRIIEIENLDKGYLKYFRDVNVCPTSFFGRIGHPFCENEEVGMEYIREIHVPKGSIIDNLDLNLNN